MPSDITGTEILEEEEGTGRRRMKFVKGPIFGNIILGDEINRTPPKTQAALLQAMQEYKVTTAGTDYILEKPFLVLGTQNPIEQEGTYPLPEAQLDRFMFKMLDRLPDLRGRTDHRRDDDRRRPAEDRAGARPRGHPGHSADGAQGADRPLGDGLRGQAGAGHPARLDEAPDFVKKYLTWGAGPRACQALLLGGKAHALLDGRVHVSTEDIRYVARPVLRHRLATSFRADSDGVTPDHIVEKLFQTVREPMER